MNDTAAVAELSAESLMGQVVDEFLERMARGEQPEVEEYARRHPALAVILRQMLPALQLLRTPEDMPAASESLESPGLGRGCLGDYRNLREVGRGGMGVVYEAEQISLNRQVALKVLPFAATLDAKQLQRFKNEAQAAAHLHHTNIVPVFGVGCERGVHYYAMQFIDGQTLAQTISDCKLQIADFKKLPVSTDATGDFTPDPAIDKPPTEICNLQSAICNPTMSVHSTERSTKSPAFFRTIANLGVQAAEGLEHAHQQGVVHRDIKPANLLVDLRGNLWITDFGLAHCQSQAGLTMSGDLVGTLRYMSPEQALAQRVVIDHRTDIYSVGATLYELLTLQPVFGGRDRQELLRQIAFEEPKPPRRLNKAIPAELETIVMKALEKNPVDRYATAQELADDLGRFLRDESIRAKRPFLAQRVRKWARRHQPMVWSALAATVAILLMAVAMLAFNNVRIHEENQRTELALEQKTGLLWKSYVNQARASSLSRRIGQRFETLEVLAKATQMARDMNLPEADFLELRNQAIACLALPDLRVAKEWDGWPTGTMSVDFTGNLERYARTDRQGVVSIRRVSDDAEIYRLPGIGGETASPIFSPDGQVLILWQWQHRRCQVWTLAGKEPAMLLEGPMDTGAFSPDSRQLARALPDGSVCLYDLPSGREMKKLEAGPRALMLAYHPRDRQLAVSIASGVQVRDLETGNVLAELAQPGAGHLAWHPDGKTLAVEGGKRIVHIWDLATRKQITRLEGHKNGGIHFSFNNAGDLLASACWDSRLRLWDPRTGQLLFQTLAYTNNFLRFTLDDQRLAWGTLDIDKLKLWQVATPLGYRTLVREAVVDKGWYYTCSIHPDGRLLAVGMRGGADLWDLASGKHLASIKLPTPNYHLLFGPSGELLTNGMDGLRRWPVQADPASPELARVGPPQKLPVPGLGCVIASSRDGRVLASAQFKGGLVLHRDRPDKPVALGPHEDVRYIALSPDGRWVATGSHSGTKVKVWHAKDGKLEKELPVESGSCVGFNPDGKWLATTGDGCRLWAVDSWEPGPHIGGGTPFTPIAFSPDGKLLAVETGYGSVRLVDPDTGREYARLEDPNQDRAGAMSFTPDGTQLVTTNNDSHSVHVWDLRAIREQLAKMGLDWDQPLYPRVRAARVVSPLQVVVDTEELQEKKD